MELAPFNVDVVNATVGAFSSRLVDNAGASQLKMRCAMNLRPRVAWLQRLSGAANVRSHAAGVGRDCSALLWSALLCMIAHDIFPMCHYTGMTAAARFTSA